MTNETHSPVFETVLTGDDKWSVEVTYEGDVTIQVEISILSELSNAVFGSHFHNCVDHGDIIKIVLT